MVVRAGYSRDVIPGYCQAWTAELSGTVGSIYWAPSKIVDWTIIGTVVNRKPFLSPPKPSLPLPLRVSQDMGALAASGINSFKFFMAYKGALMVSDEQLLHGFQRCRQLGALAQVL